MSKVEKYVQKRTTTFEFNGPHGAVSGILGMPFTVVAMAMLCTEEGCPPDLFSFDVMERIRSTAWFDYDSLLVFSFNLGGFGMDGISFRYGCAGSRSDGLGFHSS